MKRKIWIGVAIAVLLTVLLEGILIWFLSPGYHSLWKIASFNFESRVCYVIDAESGEIVDQTTLDLLGFVHDLWDYEENIMLSIEGYTDVSSERQSATVGAVWKSEGWQIIYFESQMEQDSVIDSVEGSTTGISVSFYGRNGENAVAFIGNESGEIQDLYAVCADSEEEALKVFQEHMNG